MSDAEQTTPPPEAQEPQVLPQSRWRQLLRTVLSFYGIALLLGAGALWLFGWLASEVLAQDMAAMNRDILLWIHTHISPGLEGLAHALSWIGSAYGTVLIVLLFGGWLASRRRYIDVISLLAVTAGGGILTMILKQVFKQVRPQVFPPLAIETSFSFPSGHSLTAFCLWGFIGSWIVLQEPREFRRWAAALACACVAAMIAASRMYLGVHWPTDVTAGMLVAIFWVTVCVSAQRWLVARRERRRKRVVGHAVFEPRE